MNIGPRRLFQLQKEFLKQTSSDREENQIKKFAVYIEELDKSDLIVFYPKDGSYCVVTVLAQLCEIYRMTYSYVSINNKSFDSYFVHYCIFLCLEPQRYEASQISNRHSFLFLSKKILSIVLIIEYNFTHILFLCHKIAECRPAPFRCK